MIVRSEQELQIRRIRKKLRQIEILERQSLNRELNDEETAKVSRKASLRLELKQLNEAFRESGTYGTEPADASLSSLDDSTTYQPGDGFGDEDLEVTSPPRENPVNQDVNGADPQTQRDCKPGDVTNSASPRMQGTSKQAYVPPVTRSAVTRKEEIKEFSTTEDEDKSETEAIQTAQPTTAEDREKAERRHWKKVQRKWRVTNFDVTLLEGHNDLVCDVATAGDVIVSASRDTMLKVWSVDSGKEIRSLGGHTGPVTAVIVLPHSASQEILKAYDVDGGRDCRIIISGSHDCHIRLWTLDTGHEVKSFYTYNPIRSLCYMPTTGLLLSGTSGGKIEIWDLKAGCCVKSSLIHENIITGLKVDGDLVYTACADGELKVFKYKDGELRPQYESENMRTTSGAPLMCRPIHCLANRNNILYFGDDGLNVKALDWKEGVATKLSNHQQDFGGTDAICTCDDFLLCSGYDLDNGLGYVNIRDLPDHRYLCTLDDEDTSRILCLSCDKDKQGHLVVVTGGTELKLWRKQTEETASSSQDEEEYIHPKFIRHYHRPARHSDVESDTELLSTEDESDSDSEVTEPSRVFDDVSDDVSRPGWLSWCNIL